MRNKRTDRGGMEIKQQIQKSRTKEKKNPLEAYSDIRARRGAEAMREGGGGEGREVMATVAEAATPNLPLSIPRYTENVCSIR